MGFATGDQTLLPDLNGAPGGCVGPGKPGVLLPNLLLLSGDLPSLVNFFCTFFNLVIDTKGSLGTARLTRSWSADGV